MCERVIPRLDVAAVIQVRLASQRCKRKNLRPFGDTNLTSLALAKFSKSNEISNLYLAAYEDELRKCAEPFPNVKVVQRSRESAYGEDIPSVMTYLKDVGEEVVAFIDTCTPFLLLATFDEAVRYFKQHSFKSMMPAYGTYAWYFDSEGNLMNNDPNALKANTKMLKPVYKACSAFIIAHKSRILNENTYWSLTKDDPHIYPIDETEAVDIDTELDFQIAERLYQLR